MGWRWGRVVTWILHDCRAAAGVVLLIAALGLPLPPAFADSGPSLGVVVTHLTPEAAPFFSVPDGKGALVVGITPDGAAARAGILPGDVVRILAGRVIAGPDALVAAARAQKIGAKIQVVVRRIGADRKMTLTIGDAARTPPPTTADSSARYQQAAAAFEANDPGRAAVLANELAMQGYGPAQNLYGVLIAIGAAEGGNPAAASFWYRLAAQQNESAAQNNLALQYAEGAGVPRDNARAYYWMSRAAGQGNAGAADFLRQLEPALQTEERAVAQSWLAWSPEAAQAAPAAAPPPAATAPSGPSREDVRAAQQQLARLGYDVGTPDGVAGRKTKAAIRAFQEKAGLPVDGAVTPALIAALAAAPAPAATPAATPPASPPGTPPTAGTAPTPDQGLGDLGFPSGDLEINE